MPNEKRIQELRAKGAQFFDGKPKTAFVPYKDREPATLKGVWSNSPNAMPKRIEAFVLWAAAFPVKASSLGWDGDTNSPEEVTAWLLGRDEARKAMTIV
tara:strand:+ start:290 stop:586 length:297 start_codon:yes stop_codon:yes gene_type:complete